MFSLPAPTSTPVLRQKGYEESFNRDSVKMGYLMGLKIYRQRAKSVSCASAPPHTAPGPGLFMGPSPRGGTRFVTLLPAGSGSSSARSELRLREHEQGSAVRGTSWSTRAAFLVPVEDPALWELWGQSGFVQDSPSAARARRRLGALGAAEPRGRHLLQEAAEQGHRDNCCSSTHKITTD